MVKSTRPLHLIGARANGPACPNPDCGSTKSHRAGSGWSPDEQFIRYRTCYGCGGSFVTAELVIEGTSFYRLDEAGRLRRRERYRRKYGKGGRPMPENQWPSDRIKIQYEVVKGKRGKAA